MNAHDVALYTIAAAAVFAAAVGVWWALTRAPNKPAGPAEGEADRSVDGRLNELEDKYNALTRRFTRMQGEFNALTRYDADEELNPEEDK